MEKEDNAQKSDRQRVAASAEKRPQAESEAWGWLTAGYAECNI